MSKTTSDQKIGQEIRERAQARAENTILHLKSLRNVSLILWVVLSLALFMVSGQTHGVVWPTVFIIVGAVAISLLDSFLYLLLLAVTPFIYFIPLYVFDKATGRKTVAEGLPRPLVSYTGDLLFLMMVATACVVSFKWIF